MLLVASGGIDMNFTLKGERPMARDQQKIECLFTDALAAVQSLSVGRKADFLGLVQNAQTLWGRGKDVAAYWIIHGFLIGLISKLESSNTAWNRFVAALEELRFEVGRS